MNSFGTVESLGYQCIFDTQDFFITSSNFEKKTSQDHGQICESFTSMGKNDDMSIDLILPVFVKIEQKDTVRVRIYYSAEENTIFRSMIPLSKPLDTAAAYFPNAVLASDIIKNESRKSFNFWIASDDYSIMINDIIDTSKLAKLAPLRKSNPKLHVVIHKV